MRRAPAAAAAVVVTTGSVKERGRLLARLEENAAVAARVDAEKLALIDEASPAA